MTIDTWQVTPDKWKTFYYTGQVNFTNDTWQWIRNELHMTNDTWKITPDKLHLINDSWQRTPDELHMTNDTWKNYTRQITPDKWHLTNYDEDDNEDDHNHDHNESNGMALWQFWLSLVIGCRLHTQGCTILVAGIVASHSLAVCVICGRMLCSHHMASTNPTDPTIPSPFQSVSSLFCSHKVISL